MKEIFLKAPATIANFGPGFDIFSLALEEPYDEIKIKKRDITSIRIMISGRNESIPTSVESNSAGIAATEFLKRTGVKYGVEIEIKKMMTSSAGLGTSGASASAIVYGMNKIFGSNLSNSEIIGISSKGELATGNVAHMDNVAGCLLGGFVLIKNTNPIEAIKIDIPEIPIVICVLKKREQTTRYLIPKYIELDKMKEQMLYCSRLIYAVMSKDIREIGRAINKDHISEPVRGMFIEEYEEVKEEVLGAGAYGCNISGGGSSIFAICEEEKMSKIAEIMRKNFARRNIKNEIIMTRASNRGIREYGL